MSQAIDTLAGVVHADDPKGSVSVTRGEGDTVVTLSVYDGRGGAVEVFLTHDQVTRLVMTLAATAVDM